MTDDYSKHPPTISELRADKTGSSKDWTPRDAIIAALRDIDSGEVDPETLIIGYHDKKENRPRWYWAGPNRYTMVGVLAYLQHMVITE